MSSSGPARANRRPARSHAGDGKPVRLVPDLRDQHQGRGITTEIDLGATICKHQFLETHLATFALLDADNEPR